MRVQLRIVAGSQRGRKITCQVHPDLRPTPIRVREALFNILSDEVEERVFFDVFAGTGINGLEALSRGALAVEFVERDNRLANDIQKRLKTFGMTENATLQRIDAYRWAKAWDAPPEPVIVFLSPPFADLHKRVETFLAMIAELQDKLADGSILVVQAEKHTIFERLPDRSAWEDRTYGRNLLLLWEKAPQEP